MRVRTTITLFGEEGKAFKKFAAVVGHSEKEIARVAILKYISSIIKEAQIMQQEAIKGEQHVGDGIEGQFEAANQDSPLTATSQEA